MSSERLQHELERINKRLEREKKTEKERQIEFVKAKVAKSKSRLNFIESQTPASLQASITSAENKQILLQEQINTIQSWIRYYNDLLLNHADVLADSKAELLRRENELAVLEGRAPKQPEQVSVSSVQDMWAYMQGLLQ